MKSTRDQLLTIGKAARMLQVHPNTLRLWDKDGTLPPVRVNHNKIRRYRRTDIEKLLDRNMNARKTNPLNIHNDFPLLEQFKDFVTICNYKGKILTVNQAHLRLGYKKSDLIGKNLKDYIYPKDFPGKLTPAKLQNARDFRYRGKKANGEWIWFETNSFPFYWKGERYICSISRDIDKKVEMEEKLHRSEEEIRSLIKHAPTGIYEIDFLKPAFTKVNDAMCMLSGYTRQELLTMNPFSILEPESQAIFRERIKKYIKGEKVDEDVDYTVIKKDGTRINVVLHIKPIFRNNRITGAFVVGYDVTERRRMEASILESERKFKTIFYNLPIDVALINLQGEILEVNEAGVKLHGYSSVKSMTGRKMIEFVHPKYRSKVRAAWQALIKRGSVKDIDIFQLKKDRTKIHTLVSATLLHDGNNRPASVIAMVEDITARSNTEEILREREEKFKRQALQLQAILDSAPAIIWIALDRDSQTIIGNKEAYKFSHVRAGENLSKTGKHTERLAHYKIYKNGALLSPEQMPIQQVAKTGKPFFDYELDFVFSSGLKKTIVGNVIPVFNSRNEPDGAVAAFIDISDRKLIEQRKDEFIGIVSHELKTPMTSIKAYAQILLKRFRKGADPTTFIMLSHLEEQVDKLTSLVSDMLDASRIQSGKLTLNTERFRLDNLVGEVCADMSTVINSDPYYEKNPYKIVFSRKSGSYVTADKFRLTQVINNLLTNAIKYSPDSRKIVVGTEIKKKSVIVSVRDYGIGIPKDKQRYLFERFYQIKRLNENRSRFTSLGLGLYISSSIIKQHNGSIWVDSREGKGSTFHFSLPLGK